MAYLTDSNLLLRSMQPNTVMFTQTNHAVTTLFERGEDMHVVQQCLIEFRGVATRPIPLGGLDLPPSVVQNELVRIKQLFSLLPDTSQIYPAWEKIVMSFGVRGKQVHDARIVAAMQVHGVSHILTFNTKDFLRFQTLGITVVNPTSV